MQRRLVIKLVHGFEAPEIMSAGLTVAAIAVASGANVSLWLTAEAAWLGVPGRADGVTLEHSAPLTELLAAVLASGSVSVCAQCATRRGLTNTDLLEGVRIAGAASFVNEVLADDVTALVY